MPDDSLTTSSVAPLRLERRFAASPDAVFDAWTNPEVLRRWWAAQPTWTSPGCELDLRVGGEYTLRMRADDGTIHAVAGEFREVERPERLVYTARACAARLGGVAGAARRRLERRHGQPGAPRLRRRLLTIEED
jgi:uncharacterized protein YndB with AHSA1/START domain